MPPLRNHCRYETGIPVPVEFERETVYVVFGASGQTGSVVADDLLTQSLPVRVVLRSGKTEELWKSKGAQVAFADVSDANAIAKALEGARKAYVINPPAYDVSDMSAVARNVGKAYKYALNGSSVTNVVLLSSVGAQHPTGTGNIKTTHLMESTFEEVQAPVAILRAAWFMENWASVASVASEQGVLPSFLYPLDRKIPMISAIDIGRTAAALLSEDFTGRRILELHGPEGYSPDDVAVAFSSVLGHGVYAVPTPESQWQKTLAGFGFSPQVVRDWMEMLLGFNSGHIAFEGAGETWRGQTTIEDVATGLFAAGKHAG